MFVKVENGVVTAYPYTLERMRAEYPNTSFPKNPSASTLEPFGVFEVAYQAAPAFDPESHYVEHSLSPVLLDGKWTLTQTVVAKTQDQIDAEIANKAAQARTKRDNLLAESDWTQVADAPVDKEAWATYRQALRDITTQATFPSEVTWPTKPLPEGE